MMALLRKLIFKTYVVFLLAFTVWYGHFMYPLIFGFEGKEKAAESLRELAGSGTRHEEIIDSLAVHEDRVVVNDLGYRVLKQPYIEGRFHNIGFSIEPDRASVCIRCHGSVPHDRSREVRSFLNMHAFYLACETCHIRPDPGEIPVDFRWYDKATGESVPNPALLLEVTSNGDRRPARGVPERFLAYGNYGAKIAPGRVENGRFAFLNGPDERAFVDRFLARREQLPPEQRSQVKKVIHREVNKEPIECDFCHNEDRPYVPFASLGYPPRRVRELTTSAVVGMVKKYEQFWIPKVLAPGVGGGDER